MKVLTATSETQGQRSSDFHFGLEGELLQPVSLICAADEANPDGGCGCGRAWSGVDSGKGTTTAMVRDLPGWTRGDLTTAVRDAQRRQGWYPRYIGEDDIDEIVDALVAAAERFPVGAVLETRLEVVSQRHGAASDVP